MLRACRQKIFSFSQEKIQFLAQLGYSLSFGQSLLYKTFFLKWFLSEKKEKFEKKVNMQYEFFKYIEKIKI